jgi:hypothetical protein
MISRYISNVRAQRQQLFLIDVREGLKEVDPGRESVAFLKNATIQYVLFRGLHL